jgi:hypothetical protein
LCSPSLTVDFKSKPSDCTSASSPFIYNPTGFIITGDLSCESSAPFFVIYKAGRGNNAVLVIGLYDLLGNPTT